MNKYLISTFVIYRERQEYKFYTIFWANYCEVIGNVYNNRR